MIIDDSIITRKILEVSLQRNDISWVSFSNGTAALQALKQQANLIPAVVLLDIELPDMDGFVIARLLRHQPKYNATAIICLTGFNSILNRLRARRAQVDHYMTKPFKTAEILAAIHACNRGGEYASPIDARRERRSDGPDHRR